MLCQQGSHWFDLNDSAVTSIRESDIEKQFQGKESAYMLFYRKTQLHRPGEGNVWKLPTVFMSKYQLSDDFNDSDMQ